MLKRMFSNPYFWIAQGAILILSVALTIARIPQSITIPLMVIIGALGGILSARLEKP